MTQKVWTIFVLALRYGAMKTMKMLRLGGLLLGFSSIGGVLFWGLDAAGARARDEPKTRRPSLRALDFSTEPVAPPIEPPVAPAIEPVIEPLIEPLIEPAIEPAIEPPLAPAIELPAGALARNLVLMIGDGMGFSHVAGSRMVLLGPNRRLFFESFPITGWTFTHSAAEITTDSAAGATALATGLKTQPERLSVDPQGNKLATLFEKARAAGKSTGLLTDSYLLDATPAAFVVHRESRRDYVAIAMETFASGTEVLLGESRASHEKLPGWRHALAAATTAGYRRVESTEALRTAEARAPVLGFFPEGSIADPVRAPGLAELAAAAVERLRQDPEGFVLLVETEEIDSGSHGGDFDRVARAVESLDAAARRILELVGNDGQTLVVVTSDHETGDLALLGGRQGTPLVVRWGSKNHTAEPVPRLAVGPGAERLGGVLDNAEVGQLLAQVLGLEPGSP